MKLRGSNQLGETYPTKVRLVIAIKRVASKDKSHVGGVHRVDDIVKS